MTSYSLSLRYDRRVRLAVSLGFVAALAAASQIAVPVPGTPVPITLQPLLVVLAGMMLGPVAGALSMITYLLLGAAGLPVFAPMGPPGFARLLGPTGGYLIAYPAAAYVAGFLALRHASLAGRWIAACAGIAVLFAGGLAQLTILTGSLGRAAAIGLTPFALLDLAKAFIAALLTKPRSTRAPD